MPVCFGDSAAAERCEGEQHQIPLVSLVMLGSLGPLARETFFRFFLRLTLMDDFISAGLEKISYSLEMVENHLI